MLECVYEIRRDRFARIVRTTIRVAPRDGVVELVFFAFPRREIHAGQELWFGFGGDWAQICGEERRRGCVSVCRRGHQQIILTGTHDDLVIARGTMRRPDVLL